MTLYLAKYPLPKRKYLDPTIRGGVTKGDSAVYFRTAYRTLHKPKATKSKQANSILVEFEGHLAKIDLSAVFVGMSNPIDQILKILLTKRFEKMGIGSL